jgi:putative ABC transport system permease protein
VLTALGIIIGIAAVIVMTSLGQGAAKATAESIAKMGTRRLFIRPADMITHGVSQGQGTSETLTLEHVQLLKKRAQYLSDIAPEYHKSGARVVYRNQNSVTDVWGSTPNYFQIRSLSIEQGRNFTPAEMENKAMVTVLGWDVWNTLFLGAPAVGKTIRINGREFKVIGVQKRVGASPFGNRDDQVVIPLLTSMRRLYHSEKLSDMSAECVSVEKMHDAEDEVTSIMNEALKHGPEDPPGVRIFNQGDLIESANQQSQLLTSLLAGIALVSLIVGGIGVMNIMLVSVTERTREIGIRRALGAKRKDVLYQFLIESVTLCLVGGVVGVLMGIGVSLWMGSPAESGGLGFPMLLSPEAMAVSFASSAVVGVFFGIYPAMNASLLDPITALRHE